VCRVQPGLIIHHKSARPESSAKRAVSSENLRCA
jgi:hypothetical protein